MKSRNLDFDVHRVLRAYPRIYLACHSRHVRDPDSGRLVSARQVQVLDHLDAAVPTGVTELARHLGVTASSMSLMVDRLERQRYLVRRRDPGDRRRVVVRLTDAGERVRREHSVLDPDRVGALLDQLAPDARRQALAGLQLLADGADALREAELQQEAER